MNYSPITNQNKGYESDGQEKSNLMNDNPIASRASGGTFMSQHSQSGIGGSPLMVKGTAADHTSMGYEDDPTKKGYSRWKKHFAAEHAPKKKLENK